MADTENFYGPNAVTGTKDDAPDPLKGRDVTIQTANTTTIHTEKAPEGDKKDEVKPEDKKDEVKDPEAQLQDDIQAAIDADKEVQKELTTKGIDFAAIEAEYQKDGDLSADTYAKLEKAGYPKNMVRAYIDGMEAKAERFENAVLGYAGGKDAFVGLCGFVKGLGQSYVDAFNQTIMAGNLTAIKVMVDGYKAQMTAKYGTQNRTIMGNALKGSDGVQPFANKGEMAKAINDPRYRTDKGYNAEVGARIRVTKF